MTRFAALGLFCLALILNTDDLHAAGTTDLAQQAINAHPRPEMTGRILRHAGAPGLSAGLDFSPYLGWLRSEVDEQGIPGVAMAIVSSRGILDLQTWGVRSVDNGAPIDEQTLFRIASVSKTFAGTVAAQLVEQQLSSWDAPLVQVLPQLQVGTEASSRDISLRHIMSHSTGLMPHAFSNLLDAGVDYRQIQPRLHEIPTVCTPGRCYGYQNVVFSLVADLVEVALNTSYEEFVRQHIFLPLGMQHASMTLGEFEQSQNASAPHQFTGRSWRVSTVNPAYFSVGPASGVNASILDMVRWTQAHLGAFPEVLPPALLQAQHSPVVATPHGSYFNRWPRVEQAWYGLGWRVFDYAGLRVVHHGGGVRGFRSELVLVPELDLGMVVMFNAETRVANEVVPHFLDSLLAQFEVSSD